MCGSTVVIVADDAVRCEALIAWLEAHEVAACAVSSPAMIGLVEAARPRVVVCRPGATGTALFSALQEAADPPVVVVLSDAPIARDEVYCDGRLLVAVIRSPVAMASLAQFIKTVVGITSRRGSGGRQIRVAPAADMPVPARKGPVRLRVVH